MANYRKSFNFRHGVQVDSDNFVVTSLGLVGIGTTVPTELLDVRGDATVSGLVTTTNLYVSGISTFNQVTVDGDTVTAGVVTASYLYGDGSGLTNIPTSQWVDSDVGLGYSSIYSSGNVGIATTVPYHKLQIGNNPTVSGQYGIGINSTGDIYSSGIVTAVSFVGSGSQLTGIGLTINVRTNSLVVSGVSTLGSSNATNLTIQQLNVSGFSTFAGAIDVSGHTEFDDVNISGIVTAFDLDVDGHAELDQLNVSGVSTFVGNINASGDLNLVGNLDVDGATTLDAVTISETLGVTGISTFTGNIDANGDLDVDGDLDVGGHTELDQLNVSGVSTFVGNVTIGTGNSSAVLRFGNTIKTFDIINNETGNINMYLHNGDVGVSTGRFDWIYGQTNQELMSLNYDGKLGLGKTNPDNTLHVVGTSTVTGNAWFGGNVTISGTINVDSLNISNLSGTLIGSLVGNVNSTSGVSTFANVLVSSGSSLGIGTNNPISGLDVRNETALFTSIGVSTNSVYSGSVLSTYGNVIIDGGVGIGTTYFNPSGASLQLYVPLTELTEGHINLKPNSTVGFDTSDPKAVFDFSNVGAATTRPVMVVPNIDNTAITGIAQTPTGSIIFNTSTLKFQGYTGVGWTDFH